MRKSYLFFRRRLKDSGNGFLVYLPLLHFLKFILLIGTSFTLILSPVLLYGILIAIAGIFEGNWVVLVQVISFFGVAFCLAGIIVHKNLAGRSNGYKMYARLGNSSSKFYINFYVNYLLNERKVFFILTKIVSLSTLLGAVNFFYADGHHDEIIYFGLLISTIFNNLLIYELVTFELRYLRILRNLPLRTTAYLVNAITYLLILIPELLLLIITIPSFEIVIYAFFMLSICLCIGVNAYQLDGNMSKFLKFTLGLFVTAFVALLFSISILLLIALCLIGSYTFFYKNYFKRDNSILKMKP